MKKEAISGLSVTLSLIVLLISPALAQSIDAPIKKITHYAEEYEIGNINYPQLIVYMSSLRQDIEEIMGATAEGHDTVLKAEQLKSSLGEPQEFTKWAWIETGNGGHEKRLDNEVPVWRKIIFDGKKIQIKIEAYPTIIKKSESIAYRIHFNTEFKRPSEQLDINSNIEKIKELAGTFNANPSQENAEVLAKQSVNIERAFEQSIRQSGENCDALMNDIFGSENKRESQELILNEIDFFESDKFIATIRLELCGECEWNWINLDMRLDGRGPGFQHKEERSFEVSRDKYKGMDSKRYEEETISLLNEIKQALESENYESAFVKMQSLSVLTEMWNEESNNVYEEIEDKFRTDFDSMTEEERQKCHETYCWIKKEQERRKAEENLRKANYEARKQFYLNLFNSYDKKESFFVQNQWEKRLIEEFREFGEETCDNNVDDNDNEQIDCEEAQCGGKLCGYDIITIEENNETREEKVELFCIANACRQKEGIIKHGITCGNNICEENEQETCIEDCAICLKHEPLECEGDVVFSGKDEFGCPLEPICLEEKEFCETDEDCIQPLCASVSCVENFCQITELTECQEPECIDGESKVQQCLNNNEIITEKCIEGLWKETGIECATVSNTSEEREEIVGNECIIKSDCGNENDVCSNGRCITIPENIESPIVPIQEEIEEETQEAIPDTERNEEPRENPGESSLPEEPAITGEAIFSFFRTLANRLTITGRVVNNELNFIELQENTEDNADNDGEDQENTGEGETTETQEDETPAEHEPDFEGEPLPNEEPVLEERHEEFNEDFDDRREREEKDREREEQNRRKNECNERCGMECYDMEVRPCVEDCIWQECGQELECNIDDVRKICEVSCKEKSNLDNCKDGCSDKCLKGESTWDPEKTEREEHKEEKGVFTVSGSCRTSQGITEGFIWFGGWGEPFEDIHRLKEKYYRGGETDWCKYDYENLQKQRKEFEKGLNDEFVRWFFEKYLANSVEDWQKHMSGIFEIYWRDIDISRETAFRMQCLNIDNFPKHNLLTLNYETDYGKLEFWEELEHVKLNEIEEETEIISPFMKFWIFPPREFYKIEMKKAMEKHKMPGPPEQESGNTLSEEEKQRFRTDNEFMQDIRDFNEKFGENIAVQFTDFNTNEVAFNIYIKLNEQDIMYFEPMPPNENPAQDVKIELDVEKLLDIIEYQEQDRVELESPPWNRKPRTGFVQKVTGNVKMFFMFRNLINSAKVTPSSAEKGGEFFMKEFFGIMMGDGHNEDRDSSEREGPGGCKSEEQCEEYCSNPKNMDECMEFREKELPEEWEDKRVLTGEVVRERDVVAD